MVRKKRESQEGGYIIFGKSYSFALILLMTIFLVGFVTADNPSFQYNTQFDLKRPCFDNGFFCGTTFTCNITILNPDGNVILNNQIMDNNVSFRNITVPQIQNDNLGYLTAMESCSNSTVGGSDTFLIEITGDGNPVETFPHQFIFVAIAFLFVLVGLTRERFRMFETVGGMFMFVMGVITLYPGYSFINYSNLIGLTLGSIFIGLGFYFMIESSFSRDKQEEHFDQRSEFIDDED